jgi:hypothetical protein
MTQSDRLLHWVLSFERLLRSALRQHLTAQMNLECLETVGECLIQSSPTAFYCTKRTLNVLKTVGGMPDTELWQDAKRWWTKHAA